MSSTLPSVTPPAPLAPQGLFRLAAGASVLKRLKQTMASDPRSLQEFCSDPHAVAGACSRESRVGCFPPRSLHHCCLKWSHDNLV